MKLAQPTTFAVSTLGGRVSVIIPTHDSAEALRTCLRSVKAQSYPVHEIVVVDCFSRDNTTNVASEYGGRVILAPGTQAAARNTGITNSEGEFVLLLDADQQLEDGVVEDCVSRCLREGVDAVKIPEVFVGVNFWGRCSAFWKSSVVKTWGAEGGIPRFYRRSVLPRSSVYDDRLRFWEDLELYQRISRKPRRREAWCTRHVLHYEMPSLRDVVAKYISYGRSVTLLRGTPAKIAHASTFKLTASTMVHVLKNPGKSPSIFLGCLFQIMVKVISAAFGFLVQLRQPRD